MPTAMTTDPAPAQPAVPMTRAAALRRAKILEALSQLIAEQPYSKIQVAHISQRAGVTRSGFYFYFRAKGAALAELLAELKTEFRTAASAWYTSTPHAGDDALRDGMRATVELWRRHQALMRAMIEAAATDPEARDLWLAWQNDFIDVTVTRICEEIEVHTHDNVRGLAAVLVRSTFAEMEADLRSLAGLGSGTRNLPELLHFVWSRAIFGSGDLVVTGHDASDGETGLGVNRRQ